MKITGRRKIIIMSVIISVLIISAGIYYLKIRPDAAKDFRKDIYRAMENLNSIISSFVKNKTPDNPEMHFEKASSYFGIAVGKADILLISSEPYSKLSKITKSLADKIRKNKSFIYAIWDVWNRTDEGYPFRTIYPWVMQCYSNDTLLEFVNHMNHTNWDMLIDFLGEIDING